MIGKKTGRRIDVFPKTTRQAIPRHTTRRSLYGRYLLSRRLYRSDVIYLHVAYSYIIYLISVIITDILGSRCRGLSRSTEQGMIWNITTPLGRDVSSSQVTTPTHPP